MTTKDTPHPAELPTGTVIAFGYTAWIKDNLVSTCPWCGGLGWVRIAGKAPGAPCGYITATECTACNAEGHVGYRQQVSDALFGRDESR